MSNCHQRKRACKRETWAIEGISQFEPQEETPCYMSNSTEQNRLISMVFRVFQMKPLICICRCMKAMSRRSEEHTSELQSHVNLVCRLLLEKKKKNKKT